MSYAAWSTTNDYAEYRGLLVELHKGLFYNLRGIIVVEDSQIILQHMLRRRLPKASRLHDVYDQCCAIADQLTIVHWTHHLLQFNKMADALANIAMDTKTSTQVLAAIFERLSPAWRVVLDSLEWEINHWSSMHCLRLTLTRSCRLPT